MDPLSRWRALQGLLHDAVDATTDLVAEGNASVGRAAVRVTDRIPAVARPARAVEGAARAWGGAVLGAVRGVNRLVEAASDVAWDRAGEAPEPEEVPLRADAAGTRAWAMDALVGAVNGVAGDHLAARGNALDLGLRLRASVGDLRRVVVWVHGLSTTEWSWALAGDAPLGERLARDAGMTPVWARYNTGRSVAANGRALADALDAWLTDDVEDLVLVGHSMGGLVVRSACAQAGGAPWLGRVRDVVTLGTPHRGAPLARWAAGLERGLSAVDLPATRILGRILAVRSRGIRDLEAGLAGPAVPGIRYTFLAGELVPGRVGDVIGDGLVQPASAAGPEGSGDAVRFRAAHHRIQCDPAVYAHLLAVIARR